MQIIPTILEKEFSKAEVRLGEVGTKTKWIQIDVVDNIFTGGKSFELELLKDYESFLWDVHLMVKEPINWIGKCMFMGASRIVGQVEMMSDREKFIKEIKNEGIEAGLAFDIETEIGKIPEDTDLVLLMGRKAGFEAQNFEEKVFEKIKKVRELGFKVAVDGGVKVKHLEKMKKLGVDVVYSGSNYFDLINAN